MFKRSTFIKWSLLALTLCSESCLAETFFGGVTNSDHNSSPSVSSSPSNDFLAEVAERNKQSAQLFQQKLADRIASTPPPKSVAPTNLPNNTTQPSFENPTVANPTTVSEPTSTSTAPVNTTAAPTTTQTPPSSNSGGQVYTGFQQNDAPANSSSGWNVKY
jgi:hypothetical protein